jgi:hypothetical protein
MWPKHDPTVNQVTRIRPDKHDYTTQNFSQSLKEGTKTRREATRSIAQPKNKRTKKKNSHSVPQPKTIRKNPKFLHPSSTHNKGPTTFNHNYNSQQFESKINNFKELTTENRKEQPTTIWTQNQQTVNRITEVIELWTVKGWSAESQTVTVRRVAVCDSVRRRRRRGRGCVSDGWTIDSESRTEQVKERQWKMKVCG